MMTNAAAFFIEDQVAITATKDEAVVQAAVACSMPRSASKIEARFVFIAV